jgi:hypothetical protein
LGAGCSGLHLFTCARRKIYQESSSCVASLHRQIPNSAWLPVQIRRWTCLLAPHLPLPTLFHPLALPPRVPNPSGGADAGSNSAAARALFMLPRPNLYTSTAAAQVRPTAPPAKRKATAPKHPTAATGSDMPTPKKGKVPSSRRVQHPPSPAPAPSADPSRMHIVFHELMDR